MKMDRVGVGAIQLRSGKVLVAGGVTDVSTGPFTESAEAFDPPGNTWTAITPMHHPRANTVSGTPFPDAAWRQRSHCGWE